ncbi:MAG TPA: Kae1-associated kinase Bud32 [Methanomicrobia archaeon]|nr:MAG: Kae1-associated kinase Bud32 [Thermococci archaeon]HDN81543.1 Kae1-associated kinase Bud32 [Methanomicrobia archaeon]
MAIIGRGAEAILEMKDFKDLYFPSRDMNIKIVIKKRIKKGYRLKEIDLHLRRSRTILESRLIHEAKKYIRTPTIFEIDLDECYIIMEYIEGERVKELLEKVNSEKREEICLKIGNMVGKLHKNGIIHGDLTTSNMIYRLNEIYLIDFGLGEFSREIEKQGVDMHLLKEALQSTHYKYFLEDFETVMKGYAYIVGNEKKKEILKRINEIEKRGRYVQRDSLYNK